MDFATTPAPAGARYVNADASTRIHGDSCLGVLSSEPAHHCPERWFDCGDGKCISAMWHCDGDDDCGNGADELNCDSTDTLSLHAVTCPPRHFLCTDGHLCLPDKWRCDGHTDCTDGADEANCTFNSDCMGFSCRNMECVPSRWKCDGISDCSDDSDETDCPKNSSSHHQDCDHSSHYECKSGDCIPHEKVCDEHHDCPDGDDESSDCFKDKMMKTNRSCSRKDCEQECYIAPHREICFCREGYTLSARDNVTCADVNECNIVGWCSHSCVNRIGGFECSCQEGYGLNKTDNRTCHVSGDDEPLMLFSDGSGVRGLYLRGRQYDKYFHIHDAINHVVGDRHESEEQAYLLGRPGSG